MKRPAGLGRDGPRSARAFAARLGVAAAIALVATAAMAAMPARALAQPPSPAGAPTEPRERAGSSERRAAPSERGATGSSSSWATTQAAELTRQADAHAQTPDTDAAARRYLEALRFDPTYGPAYLGLAALYERAGDLQQAERTHSVGIDHVLAFAAGHVGRARVRQRQGRVREAIADLAAAEALRPGDPAILRELAAAHVAMGALPAALAATRRLAAVLTAAGARDGAAEVRVRARALAALVSEADPVTAGRSSPAPVRRAIAAFAARR